MDRITPAVSATTSFSSFIASKIQITSPTFTLSPTLTFTSKIVPAIGAFKSVPAPFDTTGVLFSSVTGALEGVVIVALLSVTLSTSTS